MEQSTSSIDANHGGLSSSPHILQSITDSTGSVNVNEPQNCTFIVNNNEPRTAHGNQTENEPSSFNLEVYHEVCKRRKIDPRLEGKPGLILEDASVREYYYSECQIQPLPWYPDYTWNIEDIYTDLAIEGSNERFPIEKLFEHAQREQELKRTGVFYRILIEGDAGYGKTTLTHKLASDWAKRESGQTSSEIFLELSTVDEEKYVKRFDLLLTVRLGHVEESEDLKSHLKKIYEKKIKFPLDDLLEGSGKLKVLIVLDGFDEANDTTKNFVGDILEKKIWSNCYVIVTSRFDHVPKSIKGKIMSVTVKGFGPKQIAQAVGKFFVNSGHVTKEEAFSYSHGLVAMEDFGSIDNASQCLPDTKRLKREQYQTFLLQVLILSPYRELAQCPLLCLMMCCLIGDFPDRQLPDTLTGLYFAMINRNLYRETAKGVKTAENFEEWDLDFQNNKFPEEHHDSLYEFGSLCLRGLTEGRTSYTVFELTRKTRALPNDPKVRRLVEAGVLVRSFGEASKTVYQVPHRTIAEFLAAYYLRNETDGRKVNLGLLDLVARKICRNVFQFCFEMNCEQKVIDAFCDIKFPIEFLDWESTIKKHCTNSGAWSQHVSRLKSALPSTVRIEMAEPHLKFLAQCSSNIHKFDEVHLIYQHDVLCLENEQYMDQLLQLVKITGNVSVGKYYRYPFTTPLEKRPRLSVSYAGIYKGGLLENLPYLFKKIEKCDTRLATLKCTDWEKTKYTGAKEWQKPSSSKPDKSVVVLRKTLSASLQSLLESENCPTNLDFDLSDRGALSAVTDALKEPGTLCYLKGLGFNLARCSDGEGDINEKLCKVLSEYWLPDKLIHITLNCGLTKLDGAIFRPLFQRLSLSASLTSLCLGAPINLSGDELDDFVLGVLGSRIENLQLLYMTLTFSASSFSKYTEKITNCKLKKLMMWRMKLDIVGSHLFHVNETSLALEELNINELTVASELFDWMCARISNLTVLRIGLIKKRTSHDKTEPCVTQLLDSIVQTSSDTLEKLHLLPMSAHFHNKKFLESLPSFLKSCPNVQTVTLRFDWLYPDDGSDKSPDKFLPEQELGSLRDIDNSMAMLKAVLHVPKLRVTYFYKDNKSKLQLFCELIADRAKKCSGTSSKNPDAAAPTLKIKNFSCAKAAYAATVFRRRNLDFSIKQVGDNNEYEIWFPPSAI